MISQKILNYLLGLFAVILGILSFYYLNVSPSGIIYNIKLGIIFASVVLILIVISLIVSKKENKPIKIGALTAIIGFSIGSVINIGIYLSCLNKGCEMGTLFIILIEWAISVLVIFIGIIAIVVGLLIKEAS